MPTLTADYGYDIHRLELSDAEAKVIKSQTNFTKSGEVWSEEAGGMIEGEWFFDFEKKEHVIICDDGLTFNIQQFWIE